jgi:uncharacterized Zn finger protein
MECPNGCGDMEQLVSVSNDDDKPPRRKRRKATELVYERCRECGHVETVDLKTYQD